MVRHKTRWLLARLETTNETAPQPGQKQQKQQEAGFFPTKKELARAVRDNLTQCFGVSSCGAASDTHVRFVDPATQFVLIRVPREFYPLIRASLCFWTQWKNQRVALSVLSVHGSARTAKVATLRTVQKFYRVKLLRLTTSSSSTESRSGNDRPEVVKLCRELEQTIETIENIDY